MGLEPLASDDNGLAFVPSVQVGEPARDSKRGVERLQRIAPRRAEKCEPRFELFTLGRPLLWWRRSPRRELLVILRVAQRVQIGKRIARIIIFLHATLLPFTPSTHPYH